MNKWDARFLELARTLAGWSKDPGTGCGAVVVRDRRILGTGYNGLPAGIEDRYERLMDRELKLKLTLHAEDNAILNAIVPVRGATIYVWPMPPCAHCAARIIQVGITRVVAAEPQPEQAERWHQSLMLSAEVLHEAGVSLETAPNMQPAAPKSHVQPFRPETSTNAHV
jgi:dCMP deaminase